MFGLVCSFAWSPAVKAQAADCLPQASGAACPLQPRSTSAAAPIHVSSSVTVSSAAAGTVGPAPEPDSALTLTSTGAQVAVAAGAYDDIPRYLGTLPGVTFASDSRNGYLVHGGNPLENLTVLDGVEIPNLNFISTAATSGGFVSMVDTGAVAMVKLHPMLYGAQFSGALSSVLELGTIHPENAGLHGEASLGFAGADFLLDGPLGPHGSSLVEFRKSLVNYFTKDIGFDGVPVYWSLLSHETLDLGPRDNLSLLFLQGIDSLNIRPNTQDVQDPGIVNTLYGGNRATLGLTWQHESSAHVLHQLQAVSSRVHSTTVQTNALDDDAFVSSNNLVDSPATLRYDFTAQQGRFTVGAGVQGVEHGLSYNIQQPSGFPSPYLVNPAPVDASAIHADLHPLDSAGYAQLAVAGPYGISAGAGVRLQHFGLDRGTELSPQVDLRGPTFHHGYLFAGVARYAQLAPLPIMLGFAGNTQLRPIRDTQMQAGAVLQEGKGGRLTASVYRKRYFDYPVSAQFASLSLADIVDPFGQPLIAMPMVSAGTGIATGSELQYTSDPARRVFVNANVGTQNVSHQALDKVSRPADFDIPLTLNTLGGVRLGHRQLLTGRYSQHTGTPYTPFLLGPSQQQGRPIYDLTRINTQRGSLYARFDLRYGLEGRIRGHAFAAYAGMENVLGRANYFQYVIISNCSYCTPYELTQQGRFGDGGVSWQF